MEHSERGTERQPRHSPLDSGVIRAGLFLAAWCAARIVGPRGPVYWDSFGYASDAIGGRLGGLGLGRPWFAWIGAQVLRLAFALGASPWSTEPLLRGFWTVASALAAPATHALARACGLSARGAILAAMCVAFSPAFAHSSQQVLSDGPSVAMTLVALAFAARARNTSVARESAGWGSIAGVCFSLAIGLREQAAFFVVSFAWLVAISPRRARVSFGAAFAVALAAGLALMAFVALRMEPAWLAHIRAWRAAMAHERATHAYSVRDFAMYFVWLATLGIAPALAAMRAWRTERETLFAPRESLAAICVPALAQLVLLAGYQDIAYSPRYLLPALAGAIALPAALTVDRWFDARDRGPRAMALVLAAIILPAALAAPALRAREAPLRAVLDATPALLADLPDGAWVVTGQPCGAVLLTRRIVHATTARAPRWQSVCAGWGWPPSLDAFFARDASTRVIAVDLRPAAWVGAGQQRSMADAARFVASHRERVARGEIIVWR